MKNANLFSLSSKDLIKASILAGLTVIVTGAISVLTAITQIPPVYPTFVQLGSIVVSGLGAAGIYLLKNFLTNSNDQFAKPEVK